VTDSIVTMMHDNKLNE